jgi:hypothetical protein
MDTFLRCQLKNEGGNRDRPTMLSPSAQMPNPAITAMINLPGVDIQSTAFFFWMQKGRQFLIIDQAAAINHF